jgi:hypothetical protein
MCATYRAWTRSLFVRLGREAGVADAERLAQQLVLLYDGVIVAAQMDGDLTVAAAARGVAATLLDAERPIATKAIATKATTTKATATKKKIVAGRA